MITENQIKRVENDWTGIAGEPVEVEEIGGSLYGFASEIGTLRLLKAYGLTPRADQGYSVNLETHYFRLEMEGAI